MRLKKRTSSALSGTGTSAMISVWNLAVAVGLGAVFRDLANFDSLIPRASIVPVAAMRLRASRNLTVMSADRQPWI
ncbi:hypothetical protein [Mesorhizobium sp. NZP2077]|uniref:hypothetical protein n=1 Tax=Mesorhizobium sp. NZP2077 TaxID=2483404 RepID=UPI001FF060EB|nr:hypothetical protein [Mesorhizobium sp. NZP2077]